MKRRVFEEKQFDLRGRVLPYSDFRLFRDARAGFQFNEENCKGVIRRAEGVLDKEYPALIASDYMMFKRDGNRSIPHFPQYRRKVAGKRGKGGKSP